jgi:predicted nucleotidyltransferase
MDFRVEFTPDAAMSPLKQFFGLAQDLETLLGRHVDPVEAASVKHPFVQAAINRSREIVYGA